MHKTYLSKKFLFVCIFSAMFFILAVMTFVSVNIPYKTASALVWDGYVATSFDGGDGSQGSPYEIASGNQLAFLAENVNLGNDYYGVYFSLTQDIELNDVTNFENWQNFPPTNAWTPIGKYELGADYPFRGYFYGNENTITGLYCDNDENSGLFGHLGADAIVYQLNIDYSYVSAVRTSAILAGYAKNMEIDYCNVNGVVRGRDIGVGEEIEYSSVLGGFCGYGDDITISNSYSNVSVSGNSFLGGFVGELLSGIITDCDNAGDITADSNYAGGLVGSSNGSLVYCLNTGVVSGNDGLGGLAGESGDLGVVQSSLMLGSIEETGDGIDIGMLIGNNYGLLNGSFFNKENGDISAVGNSFDFADAGKERIDLVGNSLEQSLGVNWIYTPKSGNTYYYPSISGRIISFDAWQINLYDEGVLYKSTLFNDGEYTLLPIISIQGYTTSWQTADEIDNWGSQVIGFTPTSDTDLYLRKILDAPYFDVVSQDINTTYDGQFYGMEAVALSYAGNATITYQWYYSAQESGEYQALPLADSSQYLVKNHTESGFYKCGSYATDGDYLSEETLTSPIEVVIDKANASELVVPELNVFTGIYDPNKTLADYILPTDFYWTDSSIVPSRDRNYSGGIDDGYSVYYNPDLDNYISYDLVAYINLDKGDYLYKTHSELSGVYSPTQKLSDFVLDSNFYWVDENIVPEVTTTQYSALYNDDSINYNDYSLLITISLDKAEYEGITHVSMYGVYDKDKTLADYSLYNSDYRWEQPSIVPDTLTLSYNAFYNADLYNYYDFNISISLTLTKATPQVEADFDSTQKIFTDGILPAISVSSANTQGYIEWEEYSLTAGTNTYYWVFTPDDSDNYKVLRVGEEFNILVLTLERIEINTPPNIISYYSFNEVNTAGMVVFAFYNDDSTQELEHYLLEIEYENGSSFRYGDTKFYVGYQDGEIICRAEQTVTVNIIEIPMPSLVQTYYYTGESQNHDLLDSDFYSVDRQSYEDAGTYYITLSLNDKDNYCWEGSDSIDKSIEWVINPKAVTEPTITGSYDYNGLLQQADIEQSSEYTINNDLQKEAGTYTVIIQLKDKANYCWSGGSTEDVSLSWTIAKYVVAFPTYAESNFVYDKTSHKAAITPSIVYGIFNDTYVNAGEYTAEVVLKDKDNYCWEDSSNSDLEFPFAIVQRTVLPPIISGEYTYNGIKQKANISPDNEWYLITGDEQINAGNHIITVAIDSDNCIWSTGGSDAKILDFVIEKLKIDKPVLSGSYEFNGEEQAVNFPYNFYYSADEEELTFINAGSYRVYVTLDDVVNTEWSDGGERITYLDYLVEKRAIERIAFQAVAFTYTGKEITYNPVSDAFLYILSNNKKTSVGSYTASIQLKYPINYKWADESEQASNASWSIVPQSVVKPVLAKDNYYLGYEQTATIPDDTRYSVSGNKATNAGTYTATISLIDTNNYVWSDSTVAPFNISWKILRAKVEKPTSGSNLIYNGITQKFVLTENDAYEISGNTAKNGGDYTATVSLISTTNYEWSDGTTGNLSYQWKIYYVRAESEDGDNYITAFSNDGAIYPPAKAGYVFEGWYLNSDFSGEKVTSIAGIQEDIVLYAKWTNGGLLDDIVVDENKSPLSVKAIVGISVGGVLALLAVAIIIFMFVKKGMKK